MCYGGGVQQARDRMIQGVAGAVTAVNPRAAAISRFPGMLGVAMRNIQSKQQRRTGTGGTGPSSPGGAR